MILADTSVWIGHLRAAGRFAESQRSAVPPFVIGELAMGSLRRRSDVLQALSAPPGVTAATDDEVQQFVTEQRLFGLGIGPVDAHLFAATRLTPDARQLTADDPLERAAQQQGFDVMHHWRGSCR